MTLSLLEPDLVIQFDHGATNFAYQYGSQLILSKQNF